MSRILVTGGAGYIGSHTVRELSRAGHDVTVYDDLSNGHRESLDGDIALVVGEMSGQRLGEIFFHWQPEAAIHFAGAIEPAMSGTDPARFCRSNISGLIALADLASTASVPVVFSSSCAVYGTPKTLPVSESGAIKPESFYAETKVIGENILGRYGEAYGLRHIALRYFNAAGADPSGENGASHRHRVHLVTVACFAALGIIPEVTIFGDDYPTPDGTCQRDYVHVTDLAFAHLLAVDALLRGASSQVYNVGVGTPHSVREVLAAVERAAGQSIKTRVVPRRPGDPAAVWADGTRIGLELGWRPHLSELDTIAKTAWRWHEGHPNGFTEEDASD